MIWLNGLKVVHQENYRMSFLNWEKHFWAIGYAAFSSGHITDEMIKEYLEKHVQHPNHNDEDFKVE